VRTKDDCHFIKGTPHRFLVRSTYSECNIDVVFHEGFIVLLQSHERKCHTTHTDHSGSHRVRFLSRGAFVSRMAVFERHRSPALVHCIRLRNMFHSPPNEKRVAIHTIRTHASYLGSSDNNDGRKISTHCGINPY